MASKYDFRMLTIADLLEARDAYHQHLTHLDNVIGTAIGRYFIRETDPDFKDPNAWLKSPNFAERTLKNSDVKPWSQPCILVFVKLWPKKLQEIEKRPGQFVPPWLYLPDGRVIPTCVVKAPQEPDKEPPLDDILFARDLMGGGYPILSHVQGQDRIGSIGCLVTDGHNVFALTNRHVTGPPNQKALRISQAKRHKVGQAVPPSIGTITLEQAYPAWPGSRTNINLDAGLILVDNIDDWTSQVYGIGEIGKLADASEDTLSLDIIGQDVRAFGAVSGPLTGTIKALFYRYRSLAGFDYVVDFLIGPRKMSGTVATRDGDSGTIWFIEPADESQKPRPLAMQWGSTTFSDGRSQKSTELVLASNLTIICRELDVRILTDWEIGLPETWGKLGHYQIAAKACDIVANPKLYNLLQKNKLLIGLSDDDRINRRFPKDRQTSFIGLADVPDLWWKTYRGRKEGPGHYADMDQQGQGEFAGETLMSMFDGDRSTLNPDTWKRFYESIDTDRSHQGLLPFRIKQIYEAMIQFVQDHNIPKFVAAAGILAHYVADAAIPLHISYLHHGRNDDEFGVHSQFETKMVERYRAEIVATINQRLNECEIASNFTGAQQAAEVTIELARYVTDRLSPMTIINSYNNAGTGRARNENMWDDLGQATIDCQIEGTLYLAEIWESAWLEGGGNQIPNADLKRITKNKLKSLYKNKNFLKSKWLDEM